jgi:hypothetical protein
MHFRSMKAEQYLVERVDQYCGWYDRKAVNAKWWHQAHKLVAVVGSTSVPVLVNLSVIPSPYREAVVTIFSLSVAIVVSLERVFHFGDQWKNYRSSEQFLVREKFLFASAEGPYADMTEQQALALLIDRCENQISAENSATLNVITAATQASESDMFSTKKKSKAK